ncbi:MAG: PQQ-dependent sugar dehydrogenase [Maribacter sp.]
MKKTLLLSLLCSTLFASFSFSQEQVTYSDAFPNLSFQYPLEIQNANDGSNRMFVLEQQGLIKVFENNTSVSTSETFLDIRDIVSFSSGQEIGLLGLAFHPNYRSNGTFFVYHTERSTVANVGVEIVLAKYTVDPSNRNRANKNSRVELFSFDKNQGTSNHNGGKIAFGPDGYLYISVGDGGGGGDPMRNAQNLSNIFGSILRIDVDLDGSNPLESNPDLPNGNYEIPRDNPRVGQSGLDELYAWGIRNTWKFSFDKGILWGADVGQDRVEEINHIVKGGNYGWNRFEGDATYNGSSSLATNPDTNPIFEYDHRNGDLSVTGGYVYNGSSTNSLLKNKYIYADYVSGRVWSLNYNASTNSATSTLLFRTNGEYVSSFGLDESGEMYFSGYGTAAKIYKISGGKEPVPQAPTQTNGVGYWNAIAEGTNGVIQCLLEVGDDIYVGGSFTRAGNANANNFAVYNKNTGWKTSLASVNGEVKTIAITGDEQLVIGGSFSQVNGVGANNIALLNGTTWTALGSGTNGPVAKITVDKNQNIYVGGAFTNANNILANNIAVWNNGWKVLKEPSSSKPGLNNEVREIAVSANGTVYIGGNFDAAGDRSAPRIATWNGTAWGTLGTGTSGFVEAITLDGNFVYVGGNFNLASGNTVNRIARWNLASQKWEKLGNGVSGNVNAISINNGTVYAAGNFASASNDESTSLIVNNLARWNSSAGWQPLGEKLQVGSNNSVNALFFANDGESLFTAGNFTSIGGIRSNYMAQWSENFQCSRTAIVQEYEINGVWSSGEAALELEEGTKVVLSILPNNVPFTVTLPNGTVVNGDYAVGEISKSDEGIYVFTTEDGCTASLEITVLSSTDCAANTIIQEYRLDGVWESGEEVLEITEGTEVILSILPNNTDFTITLPDGTVKNGDYSLGRITKVVEGVYTYTTENGCTATLDINVLPLNDCAGANTIIQEYRLDGVWESGEDTLEVSEGTEVILSILPNETNFTITLPNGTVVNGDYSLGSISKDAAGTYTYTTENGCSATLALTVKQKVPCSSDTVQPEFRINEGTWISGERRITVDQETSLSFRLSLENESYTITSPKGDITNGTLELDEVLKTDEGIYVFTNAEGCTASFELKVIAFSSEPCPSEFKNSNKEITLTNGRFQVGLDDIQAVNTDEVGCAFELTNTDGNQPWSRYSLVLDVKNNNLQAGDVINISLEGKTISGRARIEVVYDSRPNTWDMGHNFGNTWSSYDQNITIPANTSTLDIWLFTNHNIYSGGGVAQFGNLNVVKVGSSASAKSSTEQVGTSSITTEVLVFPNPTADFITMDISKFENQALEITVVSSNNSAILNERLGVNHGNSTTMDFSKLPQGVYFVTIKTSGGESFAKKIIKN